MVQWLRHRTSTAEGAGSIPGGGTRIPQAVQLSQKKKNGNMDSNSTYLKRFGEDQMYGAWHIVSAQQILNRYVCARLLQLYPTLWTLWTVARQASLSMGFSRQE